MIRAKNKLNFSLSLWQPERRFFMPTDELEKRGIKGIERWERNTGPGNGKESIDECMDG